LISGVNIQTCSNLMRLVPLGWSHENETCRGINDTGKNRVYVTGDLYLALI
jgi:hypothetical protein